MTRNNSISVGITISGQIWQRNTGKHVEAIRLEETVDHALETRTSSTILRAFNKLGEYIWQDKLNTIQTAAGSQLERLKPKVEHLLEGAGWEVHIVDSLKRTEAADYIHSACYELQVHEVPFSATTNIGLRLDELCNESGDMRPKEETLALLKERIGIDAYDIRELSEEVRGYVLAIMQQEERDLENLHDVNGDELTTGAQSFRWFRDDEEAEQEARAYLTDDDYLWKESVAAGRTTESIGEWAEEAIRIDGWGQIVGSYDGLERIAQLADGTWFPYIRAN